LAWLLDTSVLIAVRDGDDAVTAAVRSLGAPLLMSIVSAVELEGGVHREPAESRLRRALLDEIYRGSDLLPFTDREARAYGRIVEAAGYSRRKLLDRMIAAQALVAGATLVTLNPLDFAEVEGLKIRALQG
jgi:tRNA(fMet)-specific endonuclease VapC